MAAIQVRDGNGTLQNLLLGAGDGTALTPAAYAVGGAAANGAALNGNPVLCGGSDGTNARNFATDTAGVQKVGAVPLGTVVSVGANVAAAANNQTLPAVAAKTNFLAGFCVSGLGATAAGSITITTTGLAGNLSFVLPIPAGATVGVSPLNVTFNPPLPASAVNTAIVVQVPSFGAGNTTASASAWGFVV